MKVIGCRFDGDDVIVEWYDEKEQKPQGGVVYQTVITKAAVEDWEHVGYYVNELRDDLDELIGWYEKYRKGLIA